MIDLKSELRKTVEAIAIDLIKSGCHTTWRDACADEGPDWARGMKRYRCVTCVDGRVYWWWYASDKFEPDFGWHCWQLVSLSMLPPLESNADEAERAMEVDDREEYLRLRAFLRQRLWRMVERRTAKLQGGEV